MELIRISNRKLKLMLTPTDMSHFELNADSFGEDTAQMHRTFRLLLEEIRKQTDFEADDRQISVQFFPSREGGCEMFISDLTQSEPNPKAPEKPSLLPEAPRRQRLSGRSGGGFRRDCVYRFPELDVLLSACKRLLSIGYIGKSGAWRDANGSFYLLLSVRSSSPFSLPEELQFLSEYGSIGNTAMFRLYIREHGTALCTEGAVRRLGALA